MNQSKQQSGFSLIEILVVVFIIAIVLGFARLNFNRNLDSVAHNEAKRFARVLNFTKEYSAYTGRILSLRFDKRKNTYFFLYVDPVKSSWSRLDDHSGNKLLSPHKINDRVKVSTQRDKAATSDEGVNNADNEDERRRSKSEIALITPFSDFEPAKLILRGESRNYIVTTDEFDDVEIQIQ